MGVEREKSRREMKNKRRPSKARRKSMSHCKQVGAVVVMNITVQRSNDFRNVFPTVLSAYGIVFQEIKYIKAQSLRA